MISENAKLVYDYVKTNDGKDFVASDIAEGTGLNVRQVNGVVTSAFVKKGLMVREEAEIKITKEDGTEGHKAVKFIRLTDAGRSFDPNAVEEKAE